MAPDDKTIVYGGVTTDPSVFRVDLTAQTGTYVTISGLQDIRGVDYDDTEYAYIYSLNSASPNEPRFMKVSMSTGVFPWNYRFPCPGSTCSSQYSHVVLNDAKTKVYYLYFNQDDSNRRIYFQNFETSVGTIGTSRYITDSAFLCTESLDIAYHDSKIYGTFI